MNDTEAMSIRARIEGMGRATLDALDSSRELAALFARTVRGTLRAGDRPPGELVNQMYQIGNRSLVFIAVTLGFIGMVMVYQSGIQIQRITGDMSLIGAEFIKLLVQDFGPTLTAMMLATRVGAGIAAEVGSMKVTEQIDALRMSGVAPIDYLIVPRFAAAVAMTVVLSIIGIAVAWAAGGLTAYSQFGVNPRTFFVIDRLAGIDVALGFIKATSYGMAIPTISGFCGLQAQGSSEGVGRATTAAVIGSSFAVIVLDFVISGLGFPFLTN